MESKPANDLSAGPVCPVPIAEYPNVTLAHGGGGRLSQHLIQKMFLHTFSNTMLDSLHDGAVFSVNGSRLAFSTDSYVVHPVFFPGGNIGDLAVYGTVNDLAMCGARPLYLSVGFIIEEGFPMQDLWLIVQSMKAAADRAEVLLVTGDTKVVDKGKGDGIFINTSGIGVIEEGIDIKPASARPGDKIILSGAIGLHGIAIMSVREGLEFEGGIRSDTAPLHGLVQEMLAEGKQVHVLRDPTRGGVASALNEIAASAGVGIEIHENAIPVTPEVRGACEILGFDPLYVANEGKLIACVSPHHAETVLKTMRNHPLGRESAVVGTVVREHPGLVTMRTLIGGNRVVDMLSGEQLPRIC